MVSITWRAIARLAQHSRRPNQTLRRQQTPLRHLKKFAPTVHCGCTRRSPHSKGARRYWVCVLNAQCFDVRATTEAAPDLTVLRRPPPNVVGVGGESLKIYGYVNVPLEIEDVVLYHALQVVKNDTSRHDLYLIVGMDILRTHNA